MSHDRYIPLHQFSLGVDLQVTVEYKAERGAMIPLRLHTVVISIQHDELVTMEQLRKDLMAKVIKSVIPAKYLDDETIYHLQPSGRFIIGGPQVSGYIEIITRVSLCIGSIMYWE